MQEDRYTHSVRSWLGISRIAALVLFTCLAVSATLCELLCAPGLHAPAAHDGTSHRRQAACHDPSGTEESSIAPSPSHACSDHAVEPFASSARLNAGRGDDAARPVHGDPLPATTALARATASFRPGGADSPFRGSVATRRALAFIVLRI